MQNIIEAPRAKQSYSTFCTSSSCCSSTFVESAAGGLSAVNSVIGRRSGVPLWTAGEPGTGVMGSTLGRCDGAMTGAGVVVVGGGGAVAGGAGDAPVMLGVNLCGSLFSRVGAGDAVPVAGLGCSAVCWCCC